ncbi:hypothetical protein LTR09_005501 [Extremus antarcticus]|uniref:Glycoside hydrolase family 5 domain-containing protein n=1 Tax=Extremus antarcticus TaxID=702011 RepID=A0AAJ0DN24_9PEZI|nr:hypothetical protein LTR09_005501 [Extremus antarcticus]
MESITQPKGFLRVYGVNVVDGDGRKVILKGVCFEKRIFDGSTTNQCPTRRLLGALLDVLGQEKYDYFFEKFLDYFFTRSDAKFFRSLGLNGIRIPINHRHFIDDLNPGVIKPDGFRFVDRIVEACSAEGIYSILDMHTFPGGQNQGWHSDSGIHRA